METDNNVVEHTLRYIGIETPLIIKNSNTSWPQDLRCGLTYLGMRSLLAYLMLHNYGSSPTTTLNAWCNYNISTVMKNSELYVLLFFIFPYYKGIFLKKERKKLSPYFRKAYIFVCVTMNFTTHL